MASNRFSIDYGVREAACKKCKQKIPKGAVRIAKLAANPFNDGGDMKLYHHPACIFETFKKVKATTKIIEDADDLEGWEKIEKDDRRAILELISEHQSSPKKEATPKQKKREPKQEEGISKQNLKNSPPVAKKPVPKIERVAERVKSEPDHPDNSFKQFIKICNQLSKTSSHLAKSELLHRFITNGTGTVFQGDLHVWMRLLLPGVIQRIYNMKSKQIIKVFSRIFGLPESDMLVHLEEGDVAETVGVFFEKSRITQPCEESTLNIYEVDNFLEGLSQLSREEEQQAALTRVVARCTATDLRIFVRLIKGDLRIQAGAKHVLDGLHPEAYEAFNSSRNIGQVVERVLELRQAGRPSDSLNIGTSLMLPVQPMLAMACKSIEEALQRCPNGIYSEIKYDGERVQLHKCGSEFKYFSRSLKPVMAHKVRHFAEYIPKAFPGGADMILDAEVLLIDNNSGKPLPFGSLGIHKGSDFKDANPCLFVFDCIYYNGQNLMSQTLAERRQLLQDNMREVGSRVKFSEYRHITTKSQLAEMIREVLRQGLEGLVLKDVKSTYEPGKRHWLKIKKDYLNDGAMADTADLVVLGGWYGTGQKGGMISIFLMGCHDPLTDTWRTVTKVHTGHDDASLERLQKELLPLMNKIKGDSSRVPDWLRVNRPMVPDFLIKDPRSSVVWEITGAEFSKAQLHTAGGISIRFPRVTRIRNDKTPETATNLQELQQLYTASKQHADFDQVSTTTPEKDGNPSSPSSSPEKTKRGGKLVKEKKTCDNPRRKVDPLPEVKKEKEEEDGEENDVGQGLDGIPENTRNLSNSPGKIRTSSGFLLSTVVGDLFTCSAAVSLCHCVSRDFKMSKGIAKIFRERIGRIDELEASGAHVGGIAALKDGARYIYNLVTKERYSGKPTYETLRQSLEQMRRHALANGVTHIAMPKIGCGLDLLQWPAVRTLIKNVFQHDAIRITVYVLDSADQMSPDKKIATGNSSNRHNRHDGSRREKDRRDTRQEPRLGHLFPEAGAAAKRTDSNRSTGRDIGFGYRVQRPLPDVFTGLRIFLPRDVENYEILRRHIFGYGGVCLDSADTAPTHIVHNSGSRSGSRGGGPVTRHVTLAWLVDSIKLRDRQHEKYYPTHF